MKAWLVVLAVFLALFTLFGAGLILPIYLIGSGIEDFEGQERRMASRAYFYVATYYGESFLDLGDYIGPPLVLRWHVKSVEECPPPPAGKRIEKDSYRAYAGASAKVGAYALFGIPRGKLEVTCGGHRRWEAYF